MPFARCVTMCFDYILTVAAPLCPASQYLFCFFFLLFLSFFWCRLGQLQVVTIQVGPRFPSRHDVQRHVGVIISVPQISSDRNKRQLQE